MNFKKQPLKGVEIHGAPQVGTRTVNILMGEHANEFVRGDIMDANAVIQAFDELKGNVDTYHDTLEELVNEIHANTDDIKVERNRAIAKENSIIYTKADKSALSNYVLTTALAEYAKKTDIPEIDTSDFVSKTTTDNQSIKSGLNISNNLNVVDGNNEPLIDLSIYNTPYGTNTNSSIAVKSFFDGIVDGEQTYQKGGCMIEMVAGDQRNPYIIISTGTEDSYTGEDEIKITKSGIIQGSHRSDENAEYYFAANGTVNNIYNTNNKDIYRSFDDISTRVSNEGVFVYSYNNLTYETEGVRIKNSGISITNGRQNEVFATDGSIADLSQYVLKSIYDEKIAALESRIAALEANHTTE